MWQVLIVLLVLIGINVIYFWDVLRDAKKIKNLKAQKVVIGVLVFFVVVSVFFFGK